MRMSPTPRPRHPLVLVMATMSALAVAGCGKDEAPVAPAARVLVTPQRLGVGAGGPIELEYTITRLAGEPAVPADAWVFVHMVDGGGTLLWTDDHQPMPSPAAWGDAPVVYRRTMFVPRATPAGRVRIEAGLFSRADGVRIPTAPGNPATAGFDVGPDSEALLVLFGDGWHAAEHVEQQQANEWRWTQGDARLSFRHPERDAELTIEFDQPVPSVGPQTVELRMGSERLATFTIEPRVRNLHRVPLPDARMGQRPSVELSLHVRPTFVPATTAGAGSQDTRELGVRVFNVHVGAGLRAP
jgi:hypothetical protein